MKALSSKAHLRWNNIWYTILSSRATSPVQVLLFVKSTATIMLELSKPAVRRASLTSCTFVYRSGMAANVADFFALLFDVFLVLFVCDSGVVAGCSVFGDDVICGFTIMYNAAQNVTSTTMTAITSLLSMGMSGTVVSYEVAQASAEAQNRNAHL